MAVKILTDSTADISVKEAEVLDVIRVPLKVMFDDNAYLDGVDIFHEEFYRRLAEAKDLPTTSQPAPDDFLFHFQKAKESGDSVVVITLSSAVSGTFQSANIAKEMAGYDQIYVIDSLSATAGQRALVEYARQLRNQGKGAAEIAELVQGKVDNVVIYAVIDTLEYFHKGGRLSKSVTMLGTLLSMKPLVTLTNGAVDVIAKARGVDNCIDKIMEIATTTAPLDSTLPVFYGYTGADPAFVLPFKEKFDTRFGIDAPYAPVGSVIGTHAGPGCLVIGYFKQ